MLAVEITRIGELCTSAGDAEGEVRRTLDQAGNVVSELKSVLAASSKVKLQIEGHLAESTSACTRMENMVRKTAATAEDFRLQQDQALIAIRGEIGAAEVHRKESETALGEQLDEARALVAELRAQVRRVIGPIATPDVIQVVEGLPKTRSGKIMRRILRKIAAGEFNDLGDVSTLAEPAVVEALVAARRED